MTDLLTDVIADQMAKDGVLIPEDQWDPDGVYDNCPTDGSAAAEVGALATIFGGAIVDRANPFGGKRKGPSNRASNVDKGIPESALGPSGKPKIHVKNHPTRKRAQDAAQDRSRRGGTPREDSNPTVGDPHFHPDGSYSREHHTYPKR